MPRAADPNSPATLFPIHGDCISHLPAITIHIDRRHRLRLPLLVLVSLYHGFADPPDTDEEPTPLGEAVG